MQKLITYQDYLTNGGLVIPEVTSYDKANNITSIEEKFNKWLTYTQIQLNYILQDKLEAVTYNLLNISEPYRRDIINILVIRLNRAFENDRIISHDENTQYSEMGAINWSSMSDQNPYFWNLQELQIIETSGLLEVVNLYCDEYVLENKYPANLTEEMNHRLLGSETIDIKKIVNPTNGLTSLEFSVTDKIARKSEIPDVSDFATKKELSKKQDNLVDNVEHEVGKGITHSSKYNKMLDDKFQNKKDNNLNTTSKFIVGAINEINRLKPTEKLKPYLPLSEDNQTAWLKTYYGKNNVEFKGKLNDFIQYLKSKFQDKTFTRSTIAIKKENLFLHGILEYLITSDMPTNTDILKFSLSSRNSLDLMFFSLSYLHIDYYRDLKYIYGYGIPDNSKYHYNFAKDKISSWDYENKNTTLLSNEVIVNFLETNDVFVLGIYGVGLGQYTK